MNQELSISAKGKPYLPTKRPKLFVCRNQSRHPWEHIEECLANSPNDSLVSTFMNVGQITFKEDVMNIRDNNTFCFLLKKYITFILCHLYLFSNYFLSWVGMLMHNCIILQLFMYCMNVTCKFGCHMHYKTLFNSGC